MKLGICAWVLPVEEIEAFRIASELGLDGVVINYGSHNQIHPLLSVEDPEKFIHDNPLLSETGQQRYVKEAKKYNVEIPTIALNLFCDRGITGNYNMDFAKDVVSNAINMAVNMGIAKLQIPSFYDNLVRSEQDLDRTIELFKYACNIGERKNILIGTESVLTIAQHQRLVEEVNSTHLVTLYDTQNPWRMANQDGVRIAKYMEPFTNELHAKDSRLDQVGMIQLGEGDVCFHESMAVFADQGFDGWILLESKYKGNGYEDVIKKDMDILKDIFKK